MYKLIYSIFIIIFGLASGYLLQLAIENQIRKEKLINRLQKIALLVLNPIALIGALWQVNLDDVGLLLLPFLGMLAIIFSGGVSWLYAYKMKFSNAQKGTLTISGAFTNIGNIGGVLTFIFLGEAAYALVPLYKLFEELLYYGIGFPIARAYSEKKFQTGSLFKRLFKDIYIVVAIASVVVGMTLNLSQLIRPEFFKSINQVIIPTSTYLLLITIGLNMKLTKIKKFLMPAIIISFIKSICTPIIVTLVAYLLGLGSYNNGLALKVVFILSSMPSGFLSLVPPTLYKLDVDLANAVWLVTTFGLLWIIPVLNFIIN